LGLFRTASRNPALAMRPVNYARLLRPAVSITYYLNGHHFIERELQRVAVAFRKDDNALLWWPMLKPYRRQPTVSAPRSFASNSITGLGW